MSTVRAVVFDVDGVLVRAGVFAEILEAEHGLDRQATAPFFQGPFKDCVLGRADLEVELAPFLPLWGWPGTVDDCLATWFEADSAIDVGGLAVVDALRASGMPCYVASTQERRRAAYLREVMGLTGRFDATFFSCDVGVSKPDRAFYDHVSAAIGVEPPDILLFDDHLTNVEGARAAGWRAEVYVMGDDLATMLATHRVTVG